MGNKQTDDDTQTRGLLFQVLVLTMHGTRHLLTLWLEGLNPTPPRLLSGSGRSMTGVNVFCCVETVVLQLRGKRDGTFISNLE